MMDDRLVRHPLGFWRVKDLPDLQTLRAYYESRYYQTAQSNYRPTYPAEEVAWFHAKTERIATSIAEVRGVSGGTVLDVGCGEGFAMDWFDRNGYAVRGVDFSRAGMEGAHPHLLDRLETGEVQELLDAHIAAGRTYDVIWLTNVLEHVIDPLALLTRLRQLQAAAGVLVVTVPNDGSAWQELLFSARAASRERFWIAIPDHLSYFHAPPACAPVAEATGWRCAQADGGLSRSTGTSATPARSTCRTSLKGPRRHTRRASTSIPCLPSSRSHAVNQLLRRDWPPSAWGARLTAILQARKLGMNTTTSPPDNVGRTLVGSTTQEVERQEVALVEPAAPVPHPRR
jgi:2-polyprenyl-3-methyl-5-hydroxy-6-metoxy-1,4-benzoquinol methylase